MQGIKAKFILNTEAGTIIRKKAYFDTYLGTELEYRMQTINSFAVNLQPTITRGQCKESKKIGDSALRE